MDDDITPTTQNYSSFATLQSHDSDQLFARCWRRNSCRSCLSTRLPCGWCPTSQACVPATLGLLSPLSDSMVCPSSAERFELRTRSLSCSVSTLTALTAVVSVVSTLLVVGAIYAVLKWRTQLSALCGGGGGGGGDGEAVVDENTGLLQSPREAVARSWSYWVYNTVPGDGDDRPGLERSDTSGEEGEAVGGREFEERRRRMLQRRVNEV